MDFGFDERSSVELPALDEPVYESKSEDASEVHNGVIHLVTVSGQSQIADGVTGLTLMAVTGMIVGIMKIIFVSLANHTHGGFRGDVR